MVQTINNPRNTMKFICIALTRRSVKTHNCTRRSPSSAKGYISVNITCKDEENYNKTALAVNLNVRTLRFLHSGLLHHS